MGNIPTLDGFTAGETPTAQKLTDHTKTAFEGAVYFKPYCSMTVSGTQNIPSGGNPTKLNLVTVEEDTDGISDPTNNRMVIKTAGLYRCVAGCNFATNGTGIRQAYIYRNGSLFVVNTVPGSSVDNIRMQVTKTQRFNVGDFVEAYSYQSSGSTLSTQLGLGQPFLQIEWISL